MRDMQKKFCPRCGCRLDDMTGWCPSCDIAKFQQRNREYNQYDPYGGRPANDYPDYGAPPNRGQAWGDSTGYGQSWGGPTAYGQNWGTPPPAEGRNKAVTAAVIGGILGVCLVVGIVFGVLIHNGLFADDGQEEPVTESVQTQQTTTDSTAETAGDEDAAAIQAAQAEAEAQAKAQAEAEARAKAEQEAEAKAQAEREAEAARAAQQAEYEAASGAVENTIGRYLHAFITDINNGYYSSLYSAVESGSKMERDQSQYISNAHVNEILEEYNITSMEQKSAGTFHVTVVERYWVEQEDPWEMYYTTQKCVYKVNKQSDGSWKVADFAAPIEVISREPY